MKYIWRMDGPDGKPKGSVEMDSIEEIRRYVYESLKYWAINKRNPTFTIDDVWVGKDQGDYEEKGLKHARCVMIERKPWPLWVGICGE